MGKPSKAKLELKKLEKELAAEEARHKAEMERLQWGIELLQRMFVRKKEGHIE